MTRMQLTALVIFTWTAWMPRFATAAELEQELSSLERTVSGATTVVRKHLDPAARASLDAGSDFYAPDDFQRRIRRQTPRLQNAIDRAAKLRHRLDAHEVKATDERYTRLAKVERQAALIVGGSDRFAVGARWSGTLTVDGEAKQVELTIARADGECFAGEYSETGLYGRPTRIEYRGQMNGSVVTICTGRMIHGPQRQRVIEAEVFRNQLEGEVRATDLAGKRVVSRAGAIDLTLQSKN